MTEIQATTLHLLRTLDLCGTAAFALSGALAGVRRNLDVFGVLVLSFAASSFGGIGRDLLIGAVPPAALVDWYYLCISILAGVVGFFLSPLVERVSKAIRLIDAIGPAFFA